MSHNLTAWQIDEHAFDNGWPIEEKIKFFLRYAVLAPSAHNNQPWRVEIKGSQADLYLDLRFTPFTGTLRQTAYSIGAFIENFVQASQHYGYRVEVENMALNHRREDLIASLRVEPIQEGGPRLPDLFEGVTLRHTNRGLYKPDPLPQDFLDELRGLQPAENVRLTVVTDPETKGKLSQLIAKGVRIALSMPPLRRELSDFVRYLKEEENTGMLVESMVPNPPPGDSGKEWTLHQMDPAFDSEFSRQRYAETPAVFLLSAQEEGTRSWIEVGRILQRLLLAAAKRGYNQDITAAAVEIPVFFPLVKKVADLPGRVQVIFRLGEPQDPAFTVPTPRRPAESIVTT